MLRCLSFLFAAAAYSVPPLWLQQQHRQMDADRVGCAFPFISAMFWSAALAVMLSGVAVGLGVFSWCPLKKPRTWLLTLEVAVLALPAVAGIQFICFFIVSLLLA